MCFEAPCSTWVLCCDVSGHNAKMFFCLSFLGDLKQEMYQLFLPSVNWKEEIGTSEVCIGVKKAIAKGVEEEEIVTDRSNGGMCFSFCGLFPNSISLDNWQHCFTFITAIILYCINMGNINMFLFLVTILWNNCPLFYIVFPWSFRLLFFYGKGTSEKSKYLWSDCSFKTCREIVLFF